MTHRLERNIQHIKVSMEEDEQGTQEDKGRGTGGQEPEPQPIPQAPPEEMQDIYVLILREREDEDEEAEAQVVVSTLSHALRQPSLLPAYVLCGVYLLLVASTLAFQLYCLFNPLEATVTILPRSQQVSMMGTLHLGRLLWPVTISQKQTVQTSGTGHQDARSASGTLTFYNGQFQAVTVPAGTVFSGTRGVSVVTEQQAVVPAGNPPSYGQVSVSAHAIAQGASGNLPAYDINHACCASSVLVTNTAAFTGGQDERDFATVARQDITRVATPLTTAVTHSLAGAFQGQRHPAEQVLLLPCRPSVSSDHQVGQEAGKVTVTVSETCRAVAYDEAAVAGKATALLARQAVQQYGTDYRLVGDPHASITRVTVSATANSQVWLTFMASGTWVYGLSQSTQEHITHLLVGKTTQQAMHLLVSLPGVKQASIRFSGFGDASRLPRQSRLIHLVFLVV